jgi:hypothetical protein
MTERLPNDHSEAQNAAHEDNTASLTDSGQDTTTQPEVTEPQAAPEEVPTEEQGITTETSERNISISGVRKAVDSTRETLARRLINVKRTDANKSRTGQRGAVNMRIEQIYGLEKDDDGNVAPEAIVAIPRGHTRRTYERNARKIQRSLARHNRETGADQPQEESVLYEPPFAPLDNETARRLALKEVTIRTHDAYVKLLEAAKGTERMHSGIVYAAYEGTDYADDGVLLRFTRNRLLRDGVIDETGKILKSPTEIETILQFSDHSKDESLVAEELQIETRREEEAQLAFERSRKIIDKLVESDTSLKTDTANLIYTQQRVWREMAQMAPEEDRSAVLVRIKELQTELDREERDRIAARNPRTLYPQLEDIIALLVREDTSDLPVKKKEGRHRSRVWSEIADILSSNESQRQELLESLRNYHIQLVRSRRSQKQKQPTRKQDAYDELLKTVPNA